MVLRLRSCRERAMHVWTTIALRVPHVASSPLQCMRRHDEKVWRGYGAYLRDGGKRHHGQNGEGHSGGGLHGESVKQHNNTDWRNLIPTSYLWAVNVWTVESPIERHNRP